MRKGHIIALLLIVLLAGAGIALLCAGVSGSKIPVTAGTSEEPEAKKEEELAGKEDISLEEMLTRFAEMVYTYDTRERQFYEGASAFMTENGYQMLVPFSAGEGAGEGEDRPSAVVSALNEVSCYYKLLDQGNIQVLMEAAFTLSRSGNGEILQYTKLKVKQTENGWKIDNYEPVDTIER